MRLVLSLSKDEAIAGMTIKLAESGVPFPTGRPPHPEPVEG
jgi:hypothetical protein